MSLLLNWNSFDLEQFKNQKMAEVDERVEKERLKIVTPGSVQAMVYMEKADEAERYKADPSIANSEIPHVVKEANTLGLTIDAAADRILLRRNEWKELSSNIESERQRVKQEIRDATTAAEVVSACDIDWETILNGTS